MKDKYTSIYLSDKHAAMVAEIELIKRSRKNNDDALGDYLETLRGDVSIQMDALRSAMRSVGTGPSRLKSTAAWIFEKLGRLKLNGRIRSYSDLSRLVEIEGLLALAGARRWMWEALKESQVADMVGLDLERLAMETDEHIKRLGDFRAEAAKRALL